MKKIKFIIITGLLFFILEFGMWKSSQWLHENKDNRNMSFMEQIVEKEKNDDSNFLKDFFGLIINRFTGNEEERVAEKLRQVISKDTENMESVEAAAAIKELEELLEVFENNPEMKEFVEGYSDKEKWLEQEIKLTEEEINSGSPLFLQWDRRWGYSKYGKKMIAMNGCGPTCLSMVLVGLRGDEEMNPQKVALFSEKCGYVTEGSGTDWGLMTDGAKALGLYAEEMALDRNVMLNALRSGCQIICSMRPGDFTTTGHFIVIYGEKDGKLLVHDPNSVERSEKEWEFEDIKGQIKNLWCYS